MNVDCLLANIKLHGNLFVESPDDDQLHHGTLAWRKRLNPLSQFANFHLLLPGRAIALNPLLNSIEQVLIAKRLRQKLDGPRFHGLDRHWNITMAGDKDDRHVNASFHKLSLKMKSTQPRKPHVQNETPGNIRQLGPEKLLP